MEESLKTNSFTFQFISWYDRTIFHFVERLTRHLQETIDSFRDDSFHESNVSITLGDIILENFLSEKSKHLVYLIDDYENIDEIINQLNLDIFGTNLTDIPDPENDVVVKFVHGFNPKN
jgi:hypothetical protein